MSTEHFWVIVLSKQTTGVALNMNLKKNSLFFAVLVFMVEVLYKKVLFKI